MQEGRITAQPQGQMGPLNLLSPSLGRLLCLGPPVSKESEPGLWSQRWLLRRKCTCWHRGCQLITPRLILALTCPNVAQPADKFTIKHWRFLI